MSSIIVEQPLQLLLLWPPQLLSLILLIMNQIWLAFDPNYFLLLARIES